MFIVCVSIAGAANGTCLRIASHHGRIVVRPPSPNDGHPRPEPTHEAIAREEPAPPSCLFFFLPPSAQTKPTSTQIAKPNAYLDAPVVSIDLCAAIFFCECKNKTGMKWFAQDTSRRLCLISKYGNKKNRGHVPREKTFTMQREQCKHKRERRTNTTAHGKRGARERNPEIAFVLLGIVSVLGLLGWFLCAPNKTTHWA